MRVAFKGLWPSKNLHARSGSALLISAQPGAPVLITAGQDNPFSLTVTNTSARVVTAFALVATYNVDPPPGSKRAAATVTKIYDAATEPLSAKPIQPYHQIVTANPAVGAAPAAAVQLMAVIHADGTSWGDAAWVARIQRRRAYMQQSLEVALAELRAADQNAVPRAQLVAQFQSALTFEQGATSGREQKACIQSVRGTVLKNLETLTANGATIPLKAALNHEIASLQGRLPAVQSGGGSQPGGPAGRGAVGLH